MLKRFFRFYGILIIIFFVVFCTACKNTPTIITNITEINQPYENSVIRVTVTDLKTSKMENNDSIEITADFLVENLSKQNVTLSRFCVRTYVDNVAVSNISTPATIAPGKRAEFTQAEHISKEAKKIEYHFYDPSDITNHIATFIFDVPPIEE